MSDDIDVRVSPDLHPSALLGLDDVTEATAPFISSTVDAFRSAYQFIGSIHDVREAAFADPTLTEAAALLKADDYARAKLAGVTKKFDAAMTNLKNGIASLEGMLAEPVKERASVMISGEVRATLKASDKRTEILERALAEQDHEVLSAALGGPAMLSGLSKEQHAFFLRRYNEMRDPERCARLKAMVAAQAHITKRGAGLFAQVEKAVGGIPVQDPRTGRVVRQITPQEVRAKRDASSAVYARHAS